MFMATKWKQAVAHFPVADTRIVFSRFITTTVIIFVKDFSLVHAKLRYLSTKPDDVTPTRNQSPQLPPSKSKISQDNDVSLLNKLYLIHARRNFCTKRKPSKLAFDNAYLNLT